MVVSWVSRSLRTKFHDDGDVSMKEFVKKDGGGRVMLSGCMVVRWAKVNLNAVASSDSMDFPGLIN